VTGGGGGGGGPPLNAVVKGEKVSWDSETKAQLLRPGSRCVSPTCVGCCSVWHKNLVFESNKDSETTAQLLRPGSRRVRPVCVVWSSVGQSVAVCYRLRV